MLLNNDIPMSYLFAYKNLELFGTTTAKAADEHNSMADNLSKVYEVIFYHFLDVPNDKRELRIIFLLYQLTTL